MSSRSHRASTREVASTAAKPPLQRRASEEELSTQSAQRAQQLPHSLTPGEVVQLQRTVGNHAVIQLLRGEVSGKTIQRGFEEDQKLNKTIPELLGKGKWVPSGSWTGQEGLTDKDPDVMFRAPSNSTDFIKWMFNPHLKPGDKGTMNCWEAVLFTAIEAQVLSYETVQEVYHTAAEKARNKFVHKFKKGYAPEERFKNFGEAYNKAIDVYSKTFEPYVFSEPAFYGEQVMDKEVDRLFRSDEAQVWDGESEIPYGHFVFFETRANHTALSIGEGKVLTLWPCDKMEIWKITDVMMRCGNKEKTKVSSVAPPWSAGVVKIPSLPSKDKETEDPYSESEFPSLISEDTPKKGGKHKKDNKPKKSGKKCFLTTACVEYKGLADDCEELTVLRAFRDGYMRTLPQGPALIEEYYRIAPAIVQQIWEDEAYALILEGMYDLIRRCVQFIQSDNPTAAMEEYIRMVYHLKERYLEPTLQPSRV